MKIIVMVEFKSWSNIHCTDVHLITHYNVECIEVDVCGLVNGSFLSKLLSKTIQCSQHLVSL